MKCEACICGTALCEVFGIWVVCEVERVNWVELVVCSLGQGHSELR